MKVLASKLTRSEFTNYIQNKKFGAVAPNSIVLHHTWQPTVKNWDGINSIKYLKRYYESMNWPAGPHIFIADDGIWLFTDMSEVGVHAGNGNATWEKNGALYGGYRCFGAKLKGYSIGVEVVGNYDTKVWEGETLKSSLFCVSELRKKLGVRGSDIHFHREYSPHKSCPGNSISREWFDRKLAEYEAGQRITHGYEFQISPKEAESALDLGFVDTVETEDDEKLAIGLVRVYERILFDKKMKKFGK